MVGREIWQVKISKSIYTHAQNNSVYDYKTLPNTVIVIGRVFFFAVKTRVVKRNLNYLKGRMRSVILSE